MREATSVAQTTSGDGPRAVLRGVYRRGPVCGVHWGVAPHDFAAAFSGESHREHRLASGVSGSVSHRFACAKG